MEAYTNKIYEQRMMQSSGSKQNVLRPYLEKGMNILDYGAGPSTFIFDLCKENEVNYIALDTSEYVQEELKKKNIQCISVLDPIKYKENFDIIFLSSVYHEFISYLSPIEVAQILSNIYNCLKPGGLMIFRDWYTFPKPCLDSIRSLISIKENQINYVWRWMTALQANGIINDYVYICSDEDHVGKGYVMNEADIYELIYHICFTGSESKDRESKERYHFSPSDWNYLKYNLHMDMIHHEYIHDESYDKYISQYIDYIKDIKNHYPSKEIRVFKKTLY